MDRARDLVFLGVSGHFKLGGQGKYRLRREDRIQPRRQPFLGSRVKTVAIGVGARQASVVKQGDDLLGSEIPKARRISRNPLSDAVAAAARRAFRAQPCAAFANAQ